MSRIYYKSWFGKFPFLLLQKCIYNCYVYMEHFYYGIQETAHSFDKYLLSACYVPGIALYAGEAKSLPPRANSDICQSRSERRSPGAENKLLT